MPTVAQAVGAIVVRWDPIVNADATGYDVHVIDEATRAGDYILVLGSVNGLEFSPAASTLAWRDKSLPVTLVDSRPDGNLYKVTKRGKKRVTPAP